MPLLVGIEIPRGHELLFGPRVSGLLFWQSTGNVSQSSSNLLMGGLLAIGFKVSESLRVQPELGFASKIAGDGENGGIGFQFGVGFLFSGR